MRKVSVPLHLHKRALHALGIAWLVCAALA